MSRSSPQRALILVQDPILEPLDLRLRKLISKIITQADESRLKKITVILADKWAIQEKDRILDDDLSTELNALKARFKKARKWHIAQKEVGKDFDVDRRTIDRCLKPHKASAQPAGEQSEEHSDSAMILISH